MIDLDPRWDWVEIIELGSPAPNYIKGRCNHLEIVPVESVMGEEVARLCTTCDEQLPPGPSTPADQPSERHVAAAHEAVRDALRRGERP